MTRAVIPSMFLLFHVSVSHAETLRSALLRTISQNPTVNAQRANVSAVVEKLTQARAGYLPKLNATAELGRQSQSYTTRNSTSDTGLSPGDPGYGQSSSTSSWQISPRGAGLEVRQTLFDGGKTASAVEQARSLIDGANQGLRVVEQETLFATMAAYVNVIRASQILQINRDNVAFLTGQSSVIRERHGFGDVTGVDLAQTQGRLAEARYRLSSAEAMLNAARAEYRQITGQFPDNLLAPKPLQHALPRDANGAVAMAVRSHPAILAAAHAVEAARAQIRIAQSDFLPTVGLSASMTRRYDVGSSGDRQTQASVMGKITFPLFDGGATASRVRESRSTSGQRELELDAARDAVRSAVFSSWGVFAAARAQLTAAETRASASGGAVRGVGQQYQMGEKSLSDLLNAQQEFVAARESLVTAKRDLVVASFNIVRATGALTLDNLHADLRDVAPRDSFAPTPVVREWRLRPSPVDAARGACADCASDMMDWGLRSSPGLFLKPTL